MAHNGQQIFNFTIASFRLSHTGLTPIGRPSFAQWLQCGHFIRNAEQSVQFWIGDWLLYGEQSFGKTDYEQAVAETGLDYQTLRIYKHVAASLPLSLRRNKISFHHHKEVASLPVNVQTLLLEQAEEGCWPLHKLKKEKRRLRLEAARLSSPATPSVLFLGEADDLLAGIADESIDMVLTAPPLETSNLTRIDTSLALLQKKLKDNSHVYLFTDWRTYPALMPLVARYLTVKNLLVWEQNRSAEATVYRHIYGFILFAAKGNRSLNGRRDASMLPFAASEEDVSLHSIDKPLPLLGYLIEKSTQPGEVVCDPFMETGAVCLAAKQSGRRYVGIESDEKLYGAACSRLA